jgi:hypothetical protein
MRTTLGAICPGTISGKRQFLYICAALLCISGANANAQVDLSGEWGQKIHEDAPERGAGPNIGDYTGYPINDRARLQADSWDAGKWTLEEHQCEPHPADYAVRGPGSMRIWADMDPTTREITAWHTNIMWMNPERTIYMDHRQHPSDYAPHTWGGFSTGEWVGDMLKVYTTHLKEGWLRRNGLPRSEKATMTEFFNRHGDYLTVVTIIKDPVFLTEPVIRTSNWVLHPGYLPTAQFCVPAKESERPFGSVPHHLPGTNPWLDEYAINNGFPIPALRGGAETMYPEYQDKLAAMPVPPKPEKKQ